ncbi:GntR family transcriptional regulator [Arthrobacter sp. TE12232]
MASAPIQAPAAFAGHVITCDDPGAWQDLHKVLAPAQSQDSMPSLRDLGNRLRRWHNISHAVFRWIDREGQGIAPPPCVGRNLAASAGRRWTYQPVLEDTVLETIRSDMAAGKFTAGDSITERYLSERLHTTRAQIRSSLRQLALDGLVTVDTGNGATVPIPTAFDVMELYLARKALGAIIISAAAGWTEEGRASVLSVLEGIERCSQSELEASHRLGQKFQSAIVRSTRFWRIHVTMESLSQQVLMYASVLGGRYAYPVADIQERNRRLFDAIDAGDREMAMSVWRDKMDEAAKYMDCRMNTSPIEPQPEPRFGP